MMLRRCACHRYAGALLSRDIFYSFHNPFAVPDTFELKGVSSLRLKCAVALYTYSEPAYIGRKFPEPSRCKDYEPENAVDRFK